jgi:mannose-6-phosphate isomerase-like protein (cupin superfamily)
MVSKRKITLCGIVVSLVIFFATLASINAADTTEQIVNQIDEVLKANPFPAGEKIQRIKVAEDNTVTVLVLRLVAGGEVKAHFHKTHDETVYIIKGTGQFLVNDKWVDFKPGTLHFNPMGKVHHIKNTGSELGVVIAIYTPAMKEPDFNFVQ